MSVGVEVRGIKAAVVLGAAGVVLAAGSVNAAQKTASFNVTAVHSGPAAQVTIHSKVWVTPTQARADVKHPLEGEMIMLVSDGFFYQLQPKSKRGLKGPLPDKLKSSKDNFSLLMGRFAFDAANVVNKAKKVRTEKVAGYDCDVLVSSAKQGEATRSITVWMPQKLQPKFPLKAIMADKIVKPGASVNQSVSITLSNVKVGQAIPSSTFVVPKGYQIASGPPPPVKPAGK